MNPTTLQALERRWRDSQSVDDELAYLQERARCGEPRRRPPGAPLLARIEALAELLAAGQRQALLARIAAERAAAGPIWFDYWDQLHSGLDPTPALYRGEGPGRSYGIAIALAPLSTRHGKPLAKAILRDMAPRYPSLSLAESRVVRELGAALDARDDRDAQLLLIDLLERWDIDQKSQLGFLHALSQAGPDLCLPVLERRLKTYTTDQQAVLGLLTRRDELAPSAALRAAIETWKDPSWLVFQLAHRGDLEAVPALRAALERLRADNSAALLVKLGLDALTAGAPASDSSLERIRQCMYSRLDLKVPASYDFVGRPQLPPPSLSDQFLEHADRRVRTPYEPTDDLLTRHGLDPRLTPELALVVLVAAAREHPRPHLQRAARHAIWGMGLLEIDE